MKMRDHASDPRQCIPILATAADAQALAELYAKALKKTGFKEIADPEKRDELVASIENLCSAKELWFFADGQGPITFGHYDSEKDEVITISTRDNMERHGYATKMLRALIAIFQTLKVRPVTRGGEAVAKKCGFRPSKDDASVWIQIGN